ncbi:helix-turn-helix domain-containing protein [Microbacteriaceae bacterium K1510]|nr:helix-turn-helix domain-containing protein [Microbacteriaceae bacterium K1510]
MLTGTVFFSYEFKEAAFKNDISSAKSRNNSAHTQQHLADTLGMSLVHTNKTLKRLLASQAVHWHNRVFEVLDRAKLVELAGEDMVQHRPRPFI